MRPSFPSHYASSLQSLGCNVQVSAPETVASEEEELSLHASTDIPAGRLLFPNAPLASCLIFSKIQTHCQFCFTSAASLKPPSKLSQCGSCKLARYCSRDHQVQDWAWHKRECKKLNRLSEMNPAAVTDLILLGRAVHCVQNPVKVSELITDGVLNPSSSDLLWLKGHDDAISRTQPQRHDENVQIHNMGVVMGLIPADFPQEHSVHLLNIFGINNFAVVDKHASPVAAAIYPFGALLNHSCRPSCVLSFRFDEKMGRCVMHCVVQAPLRAGDELTHAYCDVITPRERRHANLMENYFFHCQCNQPEPGREVLSNWDSLIADALSQEKDEVEFRKLQAIIELIEAKPERFEHSSSAVAARNYLIGLLAQYPQQALQYQPVLEAVFLRQLSTYRALYPPFHPLIGSALLSASQHATSAQLQRQLALEAEGVLRISHGPDHEFTEQAISLQQ